MSARIFDADEAVTLGLLAKAVAPEDLDAAVEAEVKPYLNLWLRALWPKPKHLARRLGPPITEEIIDETIAGLVARWESAEAQEGIAAFFAKEKPSWA